LFVYLNRLFNQSGSVVELVDALDSKSSIFTGVRVRFSPEPPLIKRPVFNRLFFFNSW
jgi:hypothetical protein